MTKKILRVLLPAFALIAVTGTAATILVQRYFTQQYESEWKDELRNNSARIRIILEEIIAADLATTRAMAAYISVHPDLDGEEFTRYAREIVGDSPTIRNIVAAKGFIITYVYPLKGNESVLGVDYRDVPSQLPLVMEARDSRRLVMAGPLEIIQGGRGVIGRAPVFTPPEEAGGEPRFWGIVSSVINFDEMMRAMAPTISQFQLEIALRGVDGKGEAGAVFYGDDALFENDQADVRDVTLPTGTWQLAAVPATPYPMRHPFWGTVNVAAIIIVAFLTTLTYSKIRSDVLLRDSERQLERYIKIVDDHVAICQFDEAGRITSASTTMINLMGFDESSLVGRSFNEIISEESRRAVSHEMWRKLRRGMGWHGEIPARTRGGSLLWLETDISTFPRDTDQSITYMAINQDITARKELEIVSITDRLTGLYNRQKTDLVLEEERERFIRYGEVYAVILFDVDHFKRINDRYGHLEGDRVLKKIACITGDQTRKTDVIGRWGGEEFLILCPHTNQDGALSRAEALRETIETCDFGLRANVTASFGVVGVDEVASRRTAESPDFTELILKSADDALYRAKTEGRNRVVSADFRT